MNVTADFPRQVTLTVVPPCDGLAVSVTLEMSRKNHFTYMVFVGPDGIAKVTGADLLQSFDDERRTFLMDYVDPRSAFTGRIVAKVPTTRELEGAIKAFEMYREHLSYPEGYEVKLRAALARGQDPSLFRVEVEA